MSYPGVAPTERIQGRERVRATHASAGCASVAALLDGLRTNTLPDGPVLYWHTHSAVGYEREVGSPDP